MKYLAKKVPVCLDLSYFFYCKFGVTKELDEMNAQNEYSSNQCQYHHALIIHLHH